MAASKLLPLFATVILWVEPAGAQGVPAASQQQNAPAASSPTSGASNSTEINADGLGRAYALLQRGYALADANQLEEAAAAFEQCLEIVPDSQVARVQLARVKARLQHWDAAVVHFRVASMEEPDNPELRMELARALQYGGDVEDAAAEFQKVADWPSAFQADAKSALAELAPQRRDAYIARAKAEVDAGDRTAARADFERALALDPQNPEILSQLGHLDVAERDDASALQRFQAAQRYAPDDPAVAQQIAYVRSRLEEAERAKASAELTAASPATPIRPTITPVPVSPAAPESRTYLEVSAQPIYDSRFSEGIADVKAELHWMPARSPINFYLGGRIIRDFGVSTTSAVGPVSSALTTRSHQPGHNPGRDDDDDGNSGRGGGGGGGGGNPAPSPAPDPTPTPTPTPEPPSDPTPAPAPDPAPDPTAPTVPVSGPIGGTPVTVGASLQSGTQPAIFSDNVALTGGGIEFRPPGSHLRIAVEANLAFNFFPALRNNRRTEPDYRAVLRYTRGWSGRFAGPIGLLTLGQLQHERIFSNLDTSAGFYSRHGNNVIAYLEARDGFQIVRGQSSSLGPYLIVRLVKDTKRDFFNNVGEAGAGVEFRPAGDLNLGIRAEYLYGFYYGIRTAQPNPYENRYQTIRLVLRFDQRVIG